MHMLSSWRSEMDWGAAGDMDQYIRRQEQLRVVVTYPCFTERRKDASSTAATARDDLCGGTMQESQDMLWRKIREALNVSAECRHLAAI